ncbi:MAG: hypothetical protein LBR65_10290 [Culturomica sp.]|jgi:hypothetical protein|nr:hypothetical protein [Culturomica sp.]
MKKIVLNRERSFASILSGAFLFPKQEWKSFVKVFCLLALPLILVDLIFQSTLVRVIYEGAYSSTFGLTLKQQVEASIWAMNGGWGEDAMIFFWPIVAAWLSQMVVSFWVILMSLSYLRVYQDHPEKEPGTVTAREVWRVMRRKWLPLLGWGVLYTLIVCLTFPLLFVPGIYFGVTLLFGMYLIVLRDQSIGKSLSGSFVRGEWWSTFGLLLLLSIMVGLLSSAFALPYTTQTLYTTFTSAVPDPYLLSLFMLIANLGKYLLMMIVLSGMGLKFYSILESREHTALYDRIESLGDPGKAANEPVE